MAFAAFAAPALLLLLAVSPACAQGPARESPPWGRWRLASESLSREVSRGGVSLARLARIDSARAVIADSLSATMQTPPLPAPPSDPTDLAWARQTLLFGIAQGDPRFTVLPGSQWKPADLEGWNRDGAFTLPAALTLADLKRWADARSWIESAPSDTTDRSHAASLDVEAILQEGDTLRAGSAAREWLARPPLDSSDRMDLEQALILGALAGRDTAAARSVLDSFSGRVDRRGFWLGARRRLALALGDTRRADSLTWVIVVGYPRGATAQALLSAVVPAGGTPAAGLTRDQKRALLTVCEARGDLSRFQILEQSLRGQLSQASRDSIGLRGARLAYQDRDYDELLRLARNGTWRPPPSAAGEWALLLARSLRNSSRPDSMAFWYRRAAAVGTAQERSTAFWEWAREMESQRRFAEADTLYGRFVAASGADRRDAARLRQGIDSFGRGAFGRAVARLRLVTRGSDPDARQAAWFWLYRASLALHRTAEARTALRAAAGAGSGYYALRAATALDLEKQGVKLTDPQAFWRALGISGSEPALEDATLPAGPAASANVGGPGAPSSGGAGGAAWQADPRLLRVRDRLLLFRRCGRRDWAADAQQQILDWPGLGRGMERVRRLEAIGLPDLAARSAVRDASLSRRYRFPFPFADAVAAAARGRSLAPEWIWSIMREESFFENAVVSSAGAVGLMQLMSGTARSTAEKHHLPAEPLSSPQVNLALGVAHLSDLAAEEPGDWPAVVAAYNAGLPNARRWRSPREDLDFYIEMIGYRETRQYVQEVLEDFWTYRRILREGS